MVFALLINFMKKIFQSGSEDDCKDVDHFLEYNEYDEEEEEESYHQMLERRCQETLARSESKFVIYLEEEFHFQKFETDSFFKACCIQLNQSYDKWKELENEVKQVLNDKKTYLESQITDVFDNQENLLAISFLSNCMIVLIVSGGAGFNSIFRKIEIYCPKEYSNEKESGTIFMAHHPDKSYSSLTKVKTHVQNGNNDSTTFFCYYKKVFELERRLFFKHFKFFTSGYGHLYQFDDSKFKILHLYDSIEVALLYCEGNNVLAQIRKENVGVLFDFAKKHKMDLFMNYLRSFLSKFFLEAYLQPNNSLYSPSYQFCKKQAKFFYTALILSKEVKHC